MKLEVTVAIKNGKGEPKVYQLTQTAEATEKTDRDGSKHWTMAHFQPATDNKIIKAFSKLYIDTAELKS